MKKITMFYLEECPFCQKAKKAMEELMTENPAYQSLDIEKIEESENVALAENYDYYAVPSLFIEKRSALNVQSRMIMIQSKQTSNVYLMRL